MTIRALAYVVIETNDLETWRHYATSVLGFAVTEGPGDSLYLKMDERPFRYWIVPGERECLRASGWEFNSEEDYQAALDLLDRQGVNVTPGSAEAAADRRVNGFARLQDPSGNALELCWGVIGDFERFSSPIGVRGFVTGDLGMGHIVLPAPKFDASVAFWLALPGIGLSDTVRFDMGAGQPRVRIHFMHCDNPRQHSVALVEMDNPVGCDHLLVEAVDFDEVGRALYRCEDHDIPLQVSLGRHINDEMFSFYCYSPAGFAFEFGAGGKRIEQWSDHVVTEATRGSHWGHRFVEGFRKIERTDKT